MILRNRSTKLQPYAGEIVPDADEGSPLSPKSAMTESDTSSNASGSVSGFSTASAKQAEGCSVMAAISAMVVDCVGAGVLILPAVLDGIGYMEGSIWIVAVAIFAAYMCILFVDCLKLCRELAPNRPFTRLEDVAEFSLGKIFKWHVIIFFYGTMFWLCVIYFSALGDLMSGIIPGLGSQSKILGRLICLPFIAALAMIKNFRYMAPFSYLGMIGILVTVIAMVVVSAQAISRGDASDKAYAFAPNQTFVVASSGISTIVYSFGAMLVLPTIYADSRPKERAKMTFSISMAHILVAVTYLVISVTAYVAFGSGQADVFQNFYAPDGHIHDNYKTGWYVGAVSVVVHMIVALPAILLGLARRIESHFPQKGAGEQHSDVDNSHDNSHENADKTNSDKTNFEQEKLSAEVNSCPGESPGASFWWRALVRGSLLGCAFGLACTPVSFFEQLVGLIPATTGCFLSLIWPPCMWWALVYKRQKAKNSTFSVALRKYWVRALWHVLILLVAIIAIIFGMRNAIQALIDRLKQGSAQD